MNDCSKPLENREEMDLLERSTKKVKGGEQHFTNSSTLPLSYADIGDDPREDGAGKRSYKATVLGVDDGERKTAGDMSDDGDDGDGGWPEHFEYGMKLEIVEKKQGVYDCPEIVISPSAEARLCRPWKQGLIVKLLGRKIGFKALETRINQLWVKHGTARIIDLGCDFFLVYLTSPEDHEKALENGPWLIYDHYLTVREWKPNFRPEKETIDRVAVWVRFPDLPIEYYDSDFLFFLGNRIGRTVKVDKNTQQTERGKYARLCVEVDLDQPLLPMFQIKNHVYKVEYEGLHLLCVACGTYGHYKDQCVVKAVEEHLHAARDSAKTGGGTGGGDHGAREDGPWKVVEKQRWTRKGRDKGGAATIINGRSSSGNSNGGVAGYGSRFNVLHTEDQELHESGRNGQFVPEIHAVPTSNFRYVTEKPREKQAAKVTGSHEHHSGKHVSAEIIVEVNAPRETTRREKDSQNQQPGNIPVSLIQQQSQLAHVTTAMTRRNGMCSTPDDQTKANPGSGRFMGNSSRPIVNGPQHAPRPPDALGNMMVDATLSPNTTDSANVEIDEFMDAQEQTHGHSESDDDMVVETPGL